ncbi:hypothetical protein PATA110615_14075 [Paenibacillus taichungensis]
MKKKSAPPDDPTGLVTHLLTREGVYKTYLTPATLTESEMKMKRTSIFMNNAGDIYFSHEGLSALAMARI